MFICGLIFPLKFGSTETKESVKNNLSKLQKTTSWLSGAAVPASWEVDERRAQPRLSTIVISYFLHIPKQVRKSLAAD